MNTPNPIAVHNPVLEAINSFKDYIFAHPLAKSTFHNMNSALGAASSPQILIFTGPTGVGKSTLVKAACNRLLQRHQERLASEPDFVPVVSMNAVPPNGNGFSWKDFYIRLLVGQHEPLVDRKLLLPTQMALFPGQIGREKVLEQTVTDALRRSVEEYLRRRRSRLLIIDEAQHLLLVNGRQRLECQFESLKSLTIETGVTIMLVGTYRLLDILDQSGQLTRRSQVVNFPRYDLRQSSDREEFRKILGFLEIKLSEHVPTRLDVSADYFYRKSAGCVGILKDWLTRCLEYALEEKAPFIDAAFAERFALKNRGLMTIIEEACLGETRLADVEDDRLIDLLNNGILLAREDRHRPLVVRRPGTRNPKRDPVGGDGHERNRGI